MATCAGSLEIDPANTETTPQVIPAVGNPSSPRPLPRRATAAPNRNSRPLVEPLPTPRSALGPVKLVVSAERLGCPADPVRLAECSEPSRKAWPVAQRPYPPGSRNRFVASCYAKPNVSSMSWTGPASMAAEVVRLVNRPRRSPTCQLVTRHHPKRPDPAGATDILGRSPELATRGSTGSRRRRSCWFGLLRQLGMRRR